MPTLIIHGDDDQIVPIADSALLSAKIVKKRNAQDLQGRAAWTAVNAEERAQHRSAGVLP